MKRTPRKTAPGGLIFCRLSTVDSLITSLKILNINPEILLLNNQSESVFSSHGGCCVTGANQEALMEGISSSCTYVKVAVPLCKNTPLQVQHLKSYLCLQLWRRRINKLSSLCWQMTSRLLYRKAAVPPESQYPAFWSDTWNLMEALVFSWSSTHLWLFYLIFWRLWTPIGLSAMQKSFRMALLLHFWQYFLYFYHAREHVVVLGEVFVSRCYFWRDDHWKCFQSGHDVESEHQRLRGIRSCSVGFTVYSRLRGVWTEVKRPDRLYTDKYLSYLQWDSKQADLGSADIQTT